MEMVVTTEAVRRAMLQSNRHHQQSNTRLFRGRMPFLSPNQQRQSTKATRSSTDAKFGHSNFLIGIVVVNNLAKWSFPGLRCSKSK